MKYFDREHRRLVRAVKSAQNDPDKRVEDARRRLRDYVTKLLKG